MSRTRNIFNQSIEHNLRNKNIQSLFIVFGISLSIAIISGGIFVIDGLENFALNTINSDNAFTTISITPRTSYTLDGHYYEKDSIYQLDNELSELIKDRIENVRLTQLFFRKNNIISTEANDLIGVEVLAYSFPEIIRLEDSIVVSGHNLPQNNTIEYIGAIVNTSLVDRANDLNYCVNVDSTLVIDDMKFLVQGIFSDQKYDDPTVVARFDSLSPGLTYDAESKMYVQSNYDEVVSIKDSIKSLLSNQFNSNTFEVRTYQTQLDEVLGYLNIAKFVVLFFYLLIILISCMYISNILVMASLLRGEEISIRRTVGASKVDIYIQVWLELLLLISIAMMAGFAMGLAISHMFAWAFHSALEVGC